MLLHRHKYCKKNIIKKINLTILYIKRRNVVTLDRNFKPTQDEIARKNLRQNFCLHKFKRAVVYSFTVRNNRDVNTPETL